MGKCSHEPQNAWYAGSTRKDSFPGLLEGAGNCCHLDVGLLPCRAEKEGISVVLNHQVGGNWSSWPQETNSRALTKHAASCLLPLRFSSGCIGWSPGILRRFLRTQGDPGRVSADHTWGVRPGWPPASQLRPSQSMPPPSPGWGVPDLPDAFHQFGMKTKPAWERPLSRPWTPKGQAKREWASEKPAERGTHMRGIEGGAAVPWAPTAPWALRDSAPGLWFCKWALVPRDHRCRGGRGRGWQMGK